MIPCLSKVSFEEWKQNTEKKKQKLEIFHMPHTLYISRRYVEYLEDATTLNASILQIY